VLGESIFVLKKYPFNSIHSIRFIFVALAVDWFRFDAERCDVLPYVRCAFPREREHSVHVLFFHSLHSSLTRTSSIRKQPGKESSPSRHTSNTQPGISGSRLPSVNRTRSAKRPPISSIAASRERSVGRSSKRSLTMSKTYRLVRQKKGALSRARPLLLLSLLLLSLSSPSS